ncbi:hypothetical protein [Micromonospora orduensis]|uniref:hypothetical protein n=1 Tax=Micromonospora orduensis TaxID=1420891 RepID=UPI003627E6DC
MRGRRRRIGSQPGEPVVVRPAVTARVDTRGGRWARGQVRRPVEVHVVQQAGGVGGHQVQPVLGRLSDATRHLRPARRDPGGLDPDGRDLSGLDPGGCDLGRLDLSRFDPGGEAVHRPGSRA